MPYAQFDGQFALNTTMSLDDLILQMHNDERVDTIVRYGGASVLYL